jgi:hypothetical protein
MIVQARSRFVNPLRQIYFRRPKRNSCRVTLYRTIRMMPPRGYVSSPSCKKSDCAKADTGIELDLPRRFRPSRAPMVCGFCNCPFTARESRKFATRIGISAASCAGSLIIFISTRRSRLGQTGSGRTRSCVQTGQESTENQRKSKSSSIGRGRPKRC